jgi:3',5'-cyclic AMP phosphodiesterase CpdA
VANFRLLHITDLHIAIPPEDNNYGRRTVWLGRERVYPSCANQYTLAAIAEFLSEHRNEADLILMSGDVADDGLQRNLDAAYRYIATPATDGWFVRPFTPTLDSERASGPPFFIIPGNHDRFRGGWRFRFPGGTAFDGTFGAYWHKGLGGVQSFLRNKDDTTLAVIAADFCLQHVYGATDYLGQGCAYEDVVTALVEETDIIRIANPNVGIVWISHFPPLLDIDHSLKLLETERLLNAARDNGIRYVIAGHLHRNQFNTYADINVICTGTASCTGAGELHGYWIQQFDVGVEPAGDVSVTLTKYRYKHVEGAFIEQK